VKLTAEATEGSGRPSAVSEGGSDEGFGGKLWFWLPVGPLLALDLWSKAAVFEFLKGVGFGGKFNPMARHEVFDTAFVKFQFVNWHNPGTVWGLFQEFNQPLRYVRLLAIAIIFWFVYKTPRTSRVTIAALGLIMAGALGNLYDNFLHVADWERDLGAVRDFLFFSDFFGLEAWDFPAFNVADSCITVGAVALFVILWSTDKPAAASAID
jgi:signal peptidase II